MGPDFKFLDDLKFYIFNVKLRFGVVNFNQCMGYLIGIENILLKKHTHLEHALILTAILLRYRLLLGCIDLKLNRILMNH
jgi:hypothetical protein